MKIKIVTHYAKDDPEFMLDHIGGEVFVDGELALTFADGDHETGTYIDGFINGIAYMVETFLDGRNIEIYNEDIADGVQV